MAERPHDICSVILRGWVTLRLNFRLKGYVLLHYNFGTGSFHTNKLCSGLYSTEVEFYFLK